MINENRSIGVLDNSVLYKICRNVCFYQLKKYSQFKNFLNFFPILIFILT